MYGYIASGNIGNDATFETVSHWISSRHPEIQQRCVTIAPDAASERFGLDAKALSWVPRGLSVNRWRRGAQKAIGRVVDLPRSLHIAGWSDVTVVPGMGVLESTLGTRAWGLPLWLLLTATSCRVRRRAFVLLAVGADRARSPVAHLLNLATVRLASFVSFRDAASAQSMSTGLTSRWQVTPDLVFAHPAPAKSDPRHGRIVIGVMAYYGHTDDKEQGAGLHAQYLQALVDALTLMIDDWSEMVLVGGDMADLEVAREVRRQLGHRVGRDATNKVSVLEIADFRRLSEEMSTAEVVVASRFHNLICALRLARPCVSIGYAEKSRLLLRDLDLEGYCQEIQELNPDLLVEQVAAARLNAPTVVPHLTTRVASYQSDINLLMQTMSSLLLSPPDGAR